MTVSFNSNAAIVDKNGLATRTFIAFLQSVGKGVISRTAYTYDEIAAMTPTLNDTVICSDSSVVTVGNTLAGGGANIVQAIGNGTDWKVI